MPPLSASPRRLRLGRLVFWLVDALLLIALIYVLATALTLRSIVRRTLADARAVVASREASERRLPSLDSMQRLRRDLERLEGTLRGVQHATRWATSPLSRQRVWRGLAEGMTIAQDGLGAGVELTSTAWWVAVSLESSLANDGVVNTAAGVPIRLEADLVAAGLKALGQSRERLLAAREDLARVEAALAFRGYLTPEGRLARYLGAARLGLDGALLAPTLTGARERTYLLLVQNTDELRPTGGFISAVAVVKVWGAEVRELRYMNSYEVEAYRVPHPPAPPALAQNMGGAVLLFRDGNWSPDYPTSAEVLAALYQTDMGEKVDGVVAIDTSFVKLVLGALGPIEIPGYNVTVTADNLMETVIGFWEAPLGAPSIQERDQKFGEWLAHRKDFGKALLAAGMARANGVGLSDMLPLAKAVEEGIHRKHLLAWVLGNRTAQEDLRRAGLDGAVLGGGGDYLMLVDANVGWNKVDRHIERAIRYHVALEADGPRAQVCLTYRNRAEAEGVACVHRSLYEDTYDALTRQCYWDYLRVLVPRGSELLSATGLEGETRVEEEGGRASLGGLVIVAPGEERTVCLEYRLPAGIMQQVGDEARYHLFVQKQPGTEGTTLDVTVDLGAPEATRGVAFPWKAVSAQEAGWGGTPEGDWQAGLEWTVKR